MLDPTEDQLVEVPLDQSMAIGIGQAHEAAGVPVVYIDLPSGFGATVSKSFEYPGGVFILVMPSSGAPARRAAIPMPWALTEDVQRRALNDLKP